MSTFSVTNTNDSGIGSLRQAIFNANALTGKDIINFDGVFTDTIADIISLSGSTLTITDDLSINGTGADLLSVSGNKVSRVFDISSGVTVELEGLTITNGSGGINNDGTLTISNSAISDNEGDIEGFTYADEGGGIYNTGILTLNNSVIRNNLAFYTGGLYNSGTATVSNSDIIFNGGVDSIGGIDNSGTLTLSNSTVSNNGAIADGGISNSGTLTVINSSIDDNGARSGVGGIGNSGILTVINSTISGNDASYNGGEGGIANSGTATISNSTISYNSNSGISNGGTLTISNSTIYGNSGIYGGGIYNNGTLTVNNSTINRNSGFYGGGGGIYNNRTLTLNNTTISGNTAFSSGAGIHNNGNLTVNNSTVTLNSIYFETDDFYNEEGNVGGIYNSNSGTATVKNSIIAGNSEFRINDPTIPRSPDVQGSFISNGYNLIGNLSGSTGFNASEQLNVAITELIDTTLRDNGGSVKTHALITGSLAINSGNNVDVATDTADLDSDGNRTESIPFDGRGSGFERISGGRVDIGAYEATVNVINGTRNQDTINGTAGNDIITGFGKRDTIAGGSGADAFVYTNISDLGDIITDFEVGTDKIVLRQLFQSLGLSNLTFGTATSGGYLRFETQGSDTRVLIDPDGSAGIGRAVNFITVRDVSATALNNAINFALLKLPSSTSIFTVTNTNDSGSGSLRQAIKDANASSGKDIIKFDRVFADKIADTITLSGNSLIITDDLSIDGTGADLLTVDGNYASRVFEISRGVLVEIAGLTIANGKDDSYLDDEPYFYAGGGIYNQGILTLNNSIITSNSLEYGRGIYNDGILTVSNSTISGNSSNFYVGGIYNYRTLTVSNSTITLNTSNNYNDNYQSVGGIYSIFDSITIVNNSIIAGNFDTPNDNQTNLSRSPDVRGNFTSNDFNLIGNFSGSTGFNPSEQLNVPITEVLDTTLRNNGSAVKTHALVTGSPAINGGNNVDVPVDITDFDGDGDTTEQVPFDQRGSGFERIFDGRVDIGAFEGTVNIINGTPSQEIINGTTGNDIITGYQGRDTITSGSGADAFVYTNIRDIGDTITDFETGTDKIILKQLFQSLNLDNLTFATATSGGYLRFETQGTDTTVLIDPDGSAGQSRAVKFLALSNLSATTVNNAINFAF